MRAGRCVVVDFRDDDVQALTHGQLRSLALQTRHEVFDERVSRLALEIGEETVSGLPNGPLYVQGLCIGLLGILSARYCGRAQDAQSDSRRLSPQQEHRVVELIRNQLGSKLSLATMAIGDRPQSAAFRALVQGQLQHHAPCVCPRPAHRRCGRGTAARSRHAHRRDRGGLRFLEPVAHDRADAPAHGADAQPGAARSDVGQARRHAHSSVRGIGLGPGKYRRRRARF